VISFKLLKTYHPTILAVKGTPKRLIEDEVKPVEKKLKWMRTYKPMREYDTAKLDCCIWIGTT
jgi:hypothetical protein